MTTPERARYRRVLLAVAGIAAVLTAAACSSASSPSAGASPSSSGSGSGGTTANLSSVTLTIGDQKGTGAEALLKAAGLISKLPFKVNWKLWGDATGLPSSIMVTASRDDVNKPATITSGVISAEQQLVTAFYRAGLIPANVNMSGYIVTTYNDTVTGGSS